MQTKTAANVSAIMQQAFAHGLPGGGVFPSSSVFPLSGCQVRAVPQQVPALAIVWQIIRRLLHITSKMEMFIGNFLLLLRPLNAF